MQQHADLDALVKLFTARTGISVPASRRDVFEAAVARAMGLPGGDGIDRFRERIAHDDAVVEDVARELAVGETYFFRESKHFEFVRNHVVPDVFARRGTRHVLRAWSAGCSTGEEAYSLAIVFEEASVGALCSIVGTDLSASALEHARRGVYRPWSLRGTGADLARPYLREEQGHWVLDPRIKERVEFRRMNLVTDPPVGRSEFDLVLCRNVLIYFEREAIARVARKLAASLREGGVLITGPSDPSLERFVSLERLVHAGFAFYRRKATIASVVAAPASARVVERARVFDSPSLRAESVPVVQSEGAAEILAKDDVIGAAHAAFSEGDYARAAELTGDPGLGLEARMIHVQALGNIDTRSAERECALAVEAFPMSVELSYVHANLLVALGKHAEAERALRRALYLDRSAAVCHALLGLLLVRRGAFGEAGRSFRNAHKICSALAPDAPVPLSNGESAGVMAKAMARRIEGLGVHEATS